MNTVAQLIARFAFISIVVVITALMVSHYEQIQDVQLNVFGFLMTFKAQYIETFCVCFGFFAFFISLFAVIDCFIVVMLEAKDRRSEAKYL